MRTYTDQDLTGTDLVVLLTIAYAGVAWRFSSRPVDVIEAATGATWHYGGGLEDLDLTDEMGLFSDTPSIRSIPVHVYWPEDVAALVALGHDLAGATGELSLWREGDDLADRVVLITGLASDPEYGEWEEAVSFSLEENPWDDRGSILDSRGTVQAGTTWTSRPLDNEGIPYPLVFGSPGPYQLADGTSQDASGSPATVVNSNVAPLLMLVAGHPTYAGETGSYLNIYSEDHDEFVAFPASHQADNQGRICTVVDTSSKLGVWTNDDHYWCSWHATQGYLTGPVSPAQDILIAGMAGQIGTVGVTIAPGGALTVSENTSIQTVSITFVSGVSTSTAIVAACAGLTLVTVTGAGATVWTSGVAGLTLAATGVGSAYRLDAHEPVTGAGDLLEYLLNLTTLRVDRARVANAKDYLNQIKVSGYVDSQGSAYDFIKDQLLPILPCLSMTSGAEGIYPCVFRFDSTSKDAVAELIEGPEYGLVRDGPVAYEGRDTLVNEVAISYALKARTGDYHRTRTLTGDPERVGETDYLTSTQARQSYLRYGKLTKALSTDIVYETNSADLVAMWHVLAHGFVRRVVKFSGVQRWGFLSKGDVVTCTLPKLSMSQVVGLVRSKRWDLSGFVSLEIVLLEDPVRDR